MLDELVALAAPPVGLKEMEQDLCQLLYELRYSGVLQEQLDLQPTVVPLMMDGAAAEAPPKRRSRQQRRQQRRDERHGARGEVTFSQTGKLHDESSKLLAMVLTQTGCRAAQGYLTRNPDRLNEMFETFLPVATEMTVDPFGNYFAQEIVSRLDSQRLTTFFHRLLQDSLEFVCMSHGTHVVQAAINRVASLVKQARCSNDPHELFTAEVAMITIWHALGPLVPSLMQNATGGYVVEKCIEQFTAPDSNFVYESVRGPVVELAMHRHACCVLQRILGLGTVEQQMMVVPPLVQEALRLSQHPFGNYVLQHVLSLNLAAATEDMARILVPHVMMLSQQKSASNVIEGLMRRGTCVTRDAVIDALIAVGKTQFLKMMRDRFANYVVKTACTLAEGRRRDLLHDTVREILPLLRTARQGVLRKALGDSRLSSRVTTAGLNSDGDSTTDSSNFRKCNNATEPAGPLDADFVIAAIAQLLDPALFVTQSK